MFRIKPTVESLAPAPLGKVEREQAVRDALSPIGVRVRRFSHASQAGITITYAYMSEQADAGVATQALADALDWADTDMTSLPGVVAVTTQRG